MFKMEFIRVPGGAPGSPAVPDGMVAEMWKQSPTHDARWQGLRQFNKLPQIKKTNQFCRPGPSLLPVMDSWSNSRV